MYKAILFDFDGVLTTDSTGTVSIMKYFENETDIDLEKFEKAYRKHNWNLLYGKSTHQEIWNQVCKDALQKIDISALYDSFVATPLDTKMISLAQELKEKGYIIGMITDNKTDRVEYILEHHNLRDLFDLVTISANIGSGKKEETIFESTIISNSLIYEECIFIDNNKSNLVIPNEKGMGTIFFDHNERDFEKLLEAFKKYDVDIDASE